MPLEQLQSALQALLTFPFTQQDWDSSGSAADDDRAFEANVNWLQERPRLLIPVAARFVDTLVEAGLRAELESRATQFLTLTANGSAFRLAYEAAVQVLKEAQDEKRELKSQHRLELLKELEEFIELLSAVPSGPDGQRQPDSIQGTPANLDGLQLSVHPDAAEPRELDPEVRLCATGIELIHGINAWLPDVQHELFPWTFASFLATVDLTGGERALWQRWPELERLQNALFQLAVVEAREHVWGSFLLQKCRDVQNEGRYEGLVTIANRFESVDLEATVGAMRAAAEFWTNRALERQPQTEQSGADEASTPAAGDVDNPLASAEIDAKKRKKPKRSTTRGEGETKLISALTAHHQYENGICGKTEPIGSNELARLAEVVNSTASRFFKQTFGAWEDYRALCHKFPRELATKLKRLNLDFSPDNLYGDRPPGEQKDDEGMGDQNDN